MGEVVEEDLQLLVIVKVGGDDCADRGRHGELGRGDILGGEKATEVSGQMSGTGQVQQADSPHCICVWMQSRRKDS